MSGRGGGKTSAGRCPLDSSGRAVCVLLLELLALLLVGGELGAQLVDALALVVVLLLLHLDLGAQVLVPLLQLLHLLLELGHPDAAAVGRRARRHRHLPRAGRGAALGLERARQLGHLLLLLLQLVLDLLQLLLRRRELLVLRRRLRARRRLRRAQLGELAAQRRGVGVAAGRRLRRLRAPHLRAQRRLRQPQRVHHLGRRRLRRALALELQLQNCVRRVGRVGGQAADRAPLLGEAHRLQELRRHRVCQLCAGWRVSSTRAANCALQSGRYGGVLQRRSRRARLASARSARPALLLAASAAGKRFDPGTRCAHPHRGAALR